MAKKVSDGVGKKIVEALKKQSEIDIIPVPANENQDEELIAEDFSTQDIFQEAFSDDLSELVQETSEQAVEQADFLDNLPSDDELSKFASGDKSAFLPEEPAINLGESVFNAVQPSVQQSFINPKPQTFASNESFIQELDSFEIPSNIAVLKKLITQLPSGVTRHTGAQIIKQTMEALGISMKSVLQEAQQAQEGLNQAAKECYSTIQEYKKQIQVLEKQAQNNQRHYAALNELISLFIQTGV